MTGPDEWGVQQHYVDADDRPASAPDATVAAVRAVIGLPPDDLESTAPIVTRPGRALGVGGRGRLRGRRYPRAGGSSCPTTSRSATTRWSTADGAERRLIVSPGRCWLPPEQTWGWAVQLYAARSPTAGASATCATCGALREWPRRRARGFLLVNPLHAVAPMLPQEASPYLPATRRFRNPIYLRVEVPG